MSQANIVKVGPYAYSETDMIGKGSFGKVYKGKNTTNGSTVAIKVIIVESNKQAMLIKMIKNEVEALKRSKNENIVQFLDFIVVGTNVYIVTEFCNQKDLKYYLNKHKILPEKKAVNFLKQIINAFKEMCRQQVLHRDLKPANILLHNGICKIADFGFAKTVDFSVTDYNTQMVSIVGTPLYMSPQLLDKQKYTTKSDIWSLGIIFYEMLFGKVPWAGRDPATYSKNIKSQPLTIDHDTNQISAEAEDFLNQCLKVSEEERIGWTELFTHPLIYNEPESNDSTKEDSTDGDYGGVVVPEMRIKDYRRRPVNPSNLIKPYEQKVLEKSKEMMTSQADLVKTTIDQKLKQVNQVAALTQSTFVKGNPNQQSKVISSSFNDEAKIIEAQTTLQFKSNMLKESRDLTPSPKDSKKTTLTKISEETSEEFKKIEQPLLVMKNKLTILSTLFSVIYDNEELKDLATLKFNLIITISKLISIIFKQLSSQVLTKKIKTRSQFIADYLETDNFKRLVAFVETEKKGYEEMLKTCSRKLFDLNLSSDKEKDEVLDYYQEVFNEVEEQSLLGKIIDMSNQMLYQIRFNSQIYKKLTTSQNNQVLQRSNTIGQKPKEYLEGLLALFGDDTILESFKYDKVDEILLRVKKLREENRVK